MDSLEAVNNSTLGPLLSLILFAGSLIGVIMAGVGLFQMATAGQNRGQMSHGIGMGFTLLVCGSVLSASTGSGAFVQLLMNSFYGGGAQPEMVLSQVSTQAQPAKAWVLVLFNFLVVLGWVSVIRGMMILGIAGSRREKGLGSGVIHVVAGMFMTNPVAFAQMLGYTFGRQDVVVVLLP